MKKEIAYRTYAQAHKAMTRGGLPIVTEYDEYIVCRVAPTKKSRGGWVYANTHDDHGSFLTYVYGVSGRWVDRPYIRSFNTRRNLSYGGRFGNGQYGQHVLTDYYISGTKFHTIDACSYPHNSHRVLTRGSSEKLYDGYTDRCELERNRGFYVKAIEEWEKETVSKF